MAGIIHFVPRKNLSADENLNNFIQICRSELTVFGRGLEWDHYAWPGALVFAKLGVITRKPAENERLAPEFMNFAKAYVRYQQGHNPTKTKNEGKAVRAIEAALLDVVGRADISQISFVVLDLAAELARKNYSEMAVYHAGREIERLASFVSKKELIPVDLSAWKSPFKRGNDRTKTGVAAKLEREEKLPNELALTALGEIFSNGNGDNGDIDARDTFTTCICAMLLCAPSRISEVLALPADCEVEEEDREGNVRYGWRFYARKGFAGDVKWIPTNMVPIAKEAVRRARMLSEEAREIATHYERGDFTSRLGFEVNKPSFLERISLEEACRCLGISLENRSNAYSSLRRYGLIPEDYSNTVEDVASAIQGALPDGFPYFDKEIGIKFSNALFCLCKNQLHASKSVMPAFLIRPDANFFNNDVSKRESLDGVHRNIFDRNGYKDSDGERLKVKSHSFRHMLNTMAHRGGLSNLEIAKWSGRSDVRQNRVYNHVSETEMLDLVVKADPEKEIFGGSNGVMRYAPVDDEDFALVHHGAVHVTEYGYCVHDYIISPCTKFRDCLNCSEQVCVKGESEKLARLKDRLERSERLLDKAQRDINEVGADRWASGLQRDVSRLRELIGLLESPDLEKGAQVKLTGVDFSQLGRVLDKKVRVELGSDRDEVLLKDALGLLGNIHG